MDYPALGGCLSCGVRDRRPREIRLPPQTDAFLDMRRTAIGPQARREQQHASPPYEGKPGAFPGRNTGLLVKILQAAAGAMLPRAQTLPPSAQPDAKRLRLQPPWIEPRSCRLEM